MKTIAWTMDSATAMEFFKRCMERKAETEPERAKILMELAKEGRMKSVVATNKTREEYVKDKAKHFKILRVGRRDKCSDS